MEQNQKKPTSENIFTLCFCHNVLLHLQLNAMGLGQPYSKSETKLILLTFSCFPQVFVTELKILVQDYW
jgi:hypothetical protein